MSTPGTAKRYYTSASTSPYVGGMETYLHDLMRALAALGVKSSALVHQSRVSLHSSEESLPAGGHSLLITRAATWGRLLFTPSARASRCYCTGSSSGISLRFCTCICPTLLHFGRWHCPRPDACRGSFIGIPMC